MAAGLGRQPALVRAPTELGWLHAFAEKALDRPGVDELAQALRHAGALRVAFGDVDALHAKVAREPRPAGLSARFVDLMAEVFG